MRGETQGVQEKMFTNFYASPARAGRIRAIEIVIKPMTALIDSRVKIIREGGWGGGWEFSPCLGIRVRSEIRRVTN